MIVLLTAGEVAVRGFVFTRAEELGPLLAPVVRAMMWGASPLIAPSRMVFRIFQWGFGSALVARIGRRKNGPALRQKWKVKNSDGLRRTLAFND